MSSQMTSLRPFGSRDSKVSEAALRPSGGQWRRSLLLAVLNMPLWALLSAALYAGDAKYRTIMWCGVCLVAAAGIVVLVWQAKTAGQAAIRILRSRDAFPLGWLGLFLVVFLALILNPALYVLSARLVTIL
jgi:protein-S-isoprenylcysteine O-methyltransferase Ste14